MSSLAHKSTPAPALTWTHLFPSSTAFACAEGPQWFRDQLAALPGNSERRIEVLWDSAGAAVGRVASSHGVVGINCRKFPAAQLRTAGFSYLRHFAALPNLANARWFVPLDSPAVSSAALSLYTPSRLSAKLKRGAVRLAMHTRLPFWYRDHVWIAQRECPPIEVALNPLFPHEEVRWALSSGAPEGARNRKASALMLGRDGRMLAFVKLGLSEIARKILTHEADVLQHLNSLDRFDTPHFVGSAPRTVSSQVREMVRDADPTKMAQSNLCNSPGVAGSVPRMLFSGEVDEVRVLAQTPLQGQPAPVGVTPAHQKFLAALQTSQIVRAGRTPMAVELDDRLRAIPAARSELLPIWERIKPRLGEFDVPTTLVHGDFAPWNLRLHDGKLGAFDWEYGDAGGLPLIDEIHYRLQCGWLLESWKTEQALDCLHSLAAQRPLGLEPKHVEALGAVYLLDALARLLGEGYEAEQDVITWHRNLLMQFVPLNFPRMEAAVA